MFDKFKNIYSEEHNEFLRYKQDIKSLVIQARDKAKGAKLYGREISINDPEELIALFYLLYRDYDAFHERM